MRILEAQLVQKKVTAVEQTAKKIHITNKKFWEELIAYFA
jgi:hypothetical protein